MLRLSMLLSCIFMTNTALDNNRTDHNNTKNPTNNHNNNHHSNSNSGNNNNMASNHLLLDKREIMAHDFEKYAVTCYICVNVSDNLICNQYAIDRPCKPGETFCHTLHIMDSKGTSVLVNKKCTNDKECQRNKAGCVEIDSQKMCVSCCDQNYCNVNVPTNSSNAVFDDKITKMRMLAKNLFTEREKAMTTTIKDTNNAIINNNNTKIIYFLSILLQFYHYYYRYHHHHHHHHQHHL